VVVTEIAEVPRSLEESFAYVADFTTVAEWDPGIHSWAGLLWAQRRGLCGREGRPWERRRDPDGAESSLVCSDDGC